LCFIDDFAATKWKDSANGQHIEYDQRPDVFRHAYYILYNNMFGIRHDHKKIIFLSFLLCTFPIAVGVLFDMLAFMHIWDELQVEEMIWNLLLTLSYFFIEAGCLGRDIR